MKAYRNPVRKKERKGEKSMSKAILVIDSKPEKCKDCNFRSIDGNGQTGCIVLNALDIVAIAAQEDIYKICPFKKLPEDSFYQKFPSLKHTLVVGKAAGEKY